jgi:eukaryotic-like serine/threonine-protein kinase
MPLTTSELQTLDRLLQQLLDLPQADRATWIDTLPESQQTFAPYLRASLNTSDATAGTHGVETADFLGALPNYREISKGTADPVAGEQVGPYKLIRPLGEGGMGSVWLAERIDGALRREVALKLPHRDLLDRGLAARMRRERDILAALNHNHIARLYDAGVDDLGRPYLALEFVPGVPIHTFCKANRLPLQDRVRLMAQVAHAVAHAHANLAVHRDLKPNNILVAETDGSPHVKLLDFGVAKLLTNDDGESGDRTADLTQVLGRALTPDYASPEQLHGMPVTTASDIYSLGVVLFEVVAGEKPYKLKGASPADQAQAVARADAEHASKRCAEGPYRQDANRVSGDLDAVIGKALKLDVRERYATASGLAEDLERWLAHLPVRAQPDSWGYRARRFVRRNAVAVAAVSAVGVALVAGAGVALWQAREARIEVAKTKAVKDFLLSVFSAGGVNQEDAALRRKQPIGDLLADAAKTLPQSFQGQPEIKYEIEETLGQLLYDMALLEPARALREEQIRGLERRGAPLNLRMQARVDLALAVADLGDVKGALQMLQTAADALAAERDPWSHAVRGVALSNLAMGKQFMGDGKGAMADGLLGVALLERAQPESLHFVRALVALGFVQGYNDDLPAAEKTLGRAIEVAGRLPSREAAILSTIHTSLTESLFLHRYHDRALAHSNAALEVVERSAGRDTFRWARSAIYSGYLYGLRGEAARGIPILEQAVKNFDKFGDAIGAEYASAARSFLAQVLADHGRLAEARDIAETSYRPFRDMKQGDQIPQPLVRAALRLASVLQHEGDYARSSQLFRQAVDAGARVAGAGNPDSMAAQRQLALNEVFQGRPEVAVPMLKEIVEQDKSRSQRFGAQRDLAQFALAQAYVEQGDFAQAERELNAASARLAKLEADETAVSRPAAAQVERAWGMLHLKKGDPARAKAHFERALEMQIPRHHADSPILAAARADLALALITQGERAGAGRLAEQARAAFSKHKAVAPHLRSSLMAVDKLMARRT